MTVYGLHIVAGTRTAPPRATYTCPCGHVQRAQGETDVMRLIHFHAEHHLACPLRMTETAA